MTVAVGAAALAPAAVPAPAAAARAAAHAAAARAAAAPTKDCVIDARLGFAAPVMMVTSDGALTVSGLTDSCTGPLTATGSYGRPGVPITGALGPDTCTAGVELLQLDSPAGTAEPLALSLTLTRHGTRLSVAGSGTQGSAPLTVAGSGTFTAAGGACGWSSAAVALAVTVTGGAPAQAVPAPGAHAPAPAKRSAHTATSHRRSARRAHRHAGR